MTKKDQLLIHDAQIYNNCMAELKKRLWLIDRPPTGFLDGVFYLEFMCLQMRKVCELFAFSTLTANRQLYEKVNSDFQNDWNFGRILKVVEKVNPRYFPEPFTPIRDEKTGKVVEHRGFAGQDVSFLSKDDIANIFSECCDFVHAQNHYKDLNNFYPKTWDDFLPWKEKLIRWRDQFTRLLNHHFVGVKGVPDVTLFAVYLYMEDRDMSPSVITLGR